MPRRRPKPAEEGEEAVNSYRSNGEVIRLNGEFIGVGVAVSAAGPLPSFVNRRQVP